MTIVKPQPFFSVIVPTYNRAKHLERSLRTVLAQTFREFEVIVVDDGSTDNTRTIIEGISSADHRVKYFYKENEERSIARNFGISKVEGRYVAFLDSDDTLYPNHLEVAHDLLTRNNFPEVGHLGYEAVDASGKVLMKNNNFDESFKQKLIHDNILHGNAIFIRRDIATEVNFIPSRFAILSEDWYLWLRLASRYKFHFDNTVTSAVVHHDQRSLLNIDPDKLVACTNVVVEYLKKDTPFLEEYGSKVSYHFANHYVFLALILSLTKRRRLDTIRYLFRAFRYDPTVIRRHTFYAPIKHWF
jgi:glycosyltransferase involved in cell wall biosynthesis